jgi:hypothetical protein
MNRRSLFVLIIGILALSGALTAQIRTEKPNDFTIELGGKCVLYSVNYSRTIGPSFALTAGASYFGASDFEESWGVFFLTGGLRAYMIKKDATPYIEGGVVWISAGTNAGPFGADTESGTYFYVSPGFEFRSMGGFVFRGGVNLLIINSTFAVWPGIHLGIAF